MSTSKIRNDATPSTSILNESISIGTQNEIKKSRRYIEIKKKNIGHEYNKRKNIRQINSLDGITKKFIKYVLSSKSQIINLNIVAKNINVKKRRIYDITNVLEGK
jgi:hypothetical protein